MKPGPIVCLNHKVLLSCVWPDQQGLLHNQVFPRSLTLPADFLPVRLADGRRSSEGRIEVMHDGEWGGVCNWWREPALGDVVCRQLGYPRAEKNVDEAFFGRGEGPMWLRPRCVGNETSLLHCPHWGWGKGCDKSNAAGVICVDGMCFYLVTNRICVMVDVGCACVLWVTVLVV